jgi:exodeoxyribonuclease VII large subunit
MADHPSIEERDHNLPVLSVSEISMALKRHVERTFERVRVRGEISGCKRASSGHVYFGLKDADAIIDSVCWRASAQRLTVALEDGLEVVATGRLTTYPSRSRYQIVIDWIELAGEGALLKLLEDRRRKLAEEGLFDTAAKRAIPFLPEVIGVITSPTGAVLRDILHRLGDRFPRRVLVWPVLVQGPEAADQIARAIGGFNLLARAGDVPRPDLLIVARGGGSLEDLWAFNEEAVVRATASSEIPVIAAIGHETDTTLIDYAADKRAPTPSAAAEMAVPVRMELHAAILGFASRLLASFQRLAGERRFRLGAAVRNLPQPGRLLDHGRQRLDEWGDRLRAALRVFIGFRRHRLAGGAAAVTSPQPRIAHERARLSACARALDRAVVQSLRNGEARLDRQRAVLSSTSYRRVLERGFAIVLDGDGHAVTSARSLRRGAAVTLRLKDGDRDATVGAGQPARLRGRAPHDPAARQGKLL